MLCVIIKNAFYRALFFLIIAFIPNLQAGHKSHKPLQFAISTGSYDFVTHYKLHASGATPDIEVKMVVGAPYGMVALMEGGPILPGPFMVRLFFGEDRKPVMEIQPQKNGTFEIRNMAQNTSTAWSPLLRSLGERVIQPYFRFEKGKTQTARKVSSSQLPFNRVEPLVGSQLNSEYRIHIVSPIPAKSPLSRGVDVLVTTQFKKNRRGEQILTSVATFCTKRRPTMNDPDSMIQFVQEKNGLKEISRKRIQHTSLWYPWVKKVVEKSVKKYIAMHEIHSRFVRAYQRTQKAINQHSNL